MINYALTDVIPMSEFKLAWRLTDPKWSSLAESILKRIKPLTDTRAKELFERSPVGARQRLPFDPSRYRAVAQCSLEEGDSAGERISSWFRGLPIAADGEVCLSWAPDAAVAIDWATFVANWHDFWYPFDCLCVFDESVDWAVLLGPEEYAVFIQRGPVNPLLPTSDPAYGRRLVLPIRESQRQQKKQDELPKYPANSHPEQRTMEKT